MLLCKWDFDVHLAGLKGPMSEKKRQTLVVKVTSVPWTRAVCLDFQETGDRCTHGDRFSHPNLVMIRNEYEYSSIMCIHVYDCLCR